MIFSSDLIRLIGFNFVRKKKQKHFITAFLIFILPTHPLSFLDL